jgi:PiT family inorganic phosphate transporter
MGVGSAQRMSGVRWKVVWSIVQAWVLTLPLTALISAGIAYLLTSL